MLTLKICCDNGANIHSKRCYEVTVEDLGWTEEEWNVKTEEEKQKWAWDYVMEAGWLDIWVEEVRYE